MEKLTFFALSAPEKLDRIAAYLSERLTRELNRHRYGSVRTTVTHMHTHAHRDVSVVLQVRVHSDGGNGAAAAGLSLSEHQPAGREFPQHAAAAAGGRQTAPAHPRHQLREYDSPRAVLSPTLSSRPGSSPCGATWWDTAWTVAQRLWLSRIYLCTL